MAMFETGMGWYRHFHEVRDLWPRRRFLVMHGTRVQIGWTWRPQGLEMGEVVWRADNDN